MTDNRIEVGRPRSVESPDEPTLARELYTYTTPVELGYGPPGRETQVAGLMGPRACTSPLLVTTQRLQEYVGDDSSGLRSCIPSCIRTILKELDHEVPDSDLDIFRLVGMDNLISGMMTLGQAQRYFASEGIKSRIVGAHEDILREVLENLSTGGLTLAVYGLHARVISGFEYSDKGLMLRVNDPIKREVDIVPIENWSESLINSRSRSGVLLVDDDIPLVE